jgi:DNA-binding beta-propeller fold protein YncE
MIRTEHPSPLLDTPTRQYRWHEGWISIAADKAVVSNGRTHGVVVDRKGNLYIFHQESPAILVYDQKGKLIHSWGDYPGAHGLTLVEEGEDEFLWLTDQDKPAVEKTTLNGTVCQSILPPDYARQEKYVPTWVAVNEGRHRGNGDIWVADGYGSSRVNRYSAAGDLICSLDGTEGAGRFNCPHGIWFDRRKSPMELYVADRGNRRIQVFDSEGGYLRSFGDSFLTSPDCFVIDGDTVVIPELLGRVTVLDVDDRLLYHLGENERAGKDKDPEWPNTNPVVPGKFNSPHGAALDASGNIFVVEWRIGGRVIKLERLS